jgi:hypothetical protein
VVPACNEPVRLRVPLHIGHLQAPVAAYLEVCALCGHSYIPALPVVELIPQTRPWWHRRPRRVLAALWRIHLLGSRSVPLALTWVFMRLAGIR